MRNGLVLDDDGSKLWYFNDQLHRTDGPAIEHSNGTKKWCLNGLLHRVDGPACEYPDGSKFWWVNNQYHRLDGPACEYTDRSKQWYVRDMNITDWIKQQGISDNPSQEEQLLIKLTWG